MEKIYTLFLNFKNKHNDVVKNDKINKNKNNNSEYTIEEVSKHDNLDSAWVVINDKIYDVTQWGHDHPGGNSIFDHLGCDITREFEIYHKYTPKLTINKILGNLYIGNLKK